MAYRTYSPINGFIVNPDGSADFKTISDALTAVQAALTAGYITKGIVYINPATYTEDFLMPPNTTLTTFGGCEDLPNVIINGKITFSSAGNYVIFGCELRTNGDYALVMSGSNAINIQLDSCYKNALNHTFGQLTNSNSSSIINSQYTKGNIATTGITLYDASTYGGRWVNNQIVISNTGGSITQSVISGTFNNINNSIISFPIVTTSTQFNLERTNHSTFGLNITPLIVNAGAAPIFFSALSGGNAPSLTINFPGGCIIDETKFNSNMDYVISGNGEVVFSSLFGPGLVNLDPSLSLVKAGLTTLAELNLLNPLSHLYGGTDITSPGASGNVLTSNGTNWVSSSAGASGGGGVINDIAISTAASVNTAYNATAALTLTLPTSPIQSDTIQIICSHAGPIVIQANTGQTIKVGSNNSTSAGTATNTAIGDTLTLRYLSSSSTWRSVSTNGNWSMA